MLKSFEGLCSVSEDRGLHSCCQSAATAEEEEYLCAYERIRWSEGVCRLNEAVDHL